MQIHFQSEYLHLLFCDKYFKDDAIGVKATKSYRMVVNYLLSAHSLNDLHAARFLDLSEQMPYSVRIDNKRRLYLDITDDQIHLINIVETKS